MCGICGIFNLQQGTVEPEALDRATDVLAHRGPDGRGVWFNQNKYVGLGHRRLAIIDTSDGGRQPMTHPASSAVLVYNGEVFNYRELREQLVSEGYSFRSQSDSEVVLLAFDRWGIDCVEKFNGMFAFALWSEDEQALWLVRDRMGIKPLYWTEVSGNFVFGSEPKALFATKLLKARANHRNLPEYLKYRYIAGEDTLFENVRQLLPGHAMRVTVDRRGSHTYFDLRQTLNREKTKSEDLRLLLDAAVERWMIADVQVGSLNSGGLDSSLISARASAISGVQLHTYNATYRDISDQGYDESPFALMLRDHIGSVHTEVGLGPDEYLQTLKRFTWYHDDPVTHPNSIPLFKMFRQAREDGVIVLLSGEGADEVFCGYNGYTGIPIARALRRVPGLALLVRSLSGVLGHRRALNNLLTCSVEELPLQLQVFADAADLSWLGPTDWNMGDERRLAVLERCVPQDGSFFKFLVAANQLFYLPHLLLRADRTSMACSVEARVPFMDNEIVAFGNALTTSQKVSFYPREGKMPLKQVAQGVLPDSIINRPKWGFAAPVLDWFQQRAGGFGEVADLMLCSRSISRGLTSRRNLERVIDQHRTGKWNGGELLWALLSLEFWRTEVLEQ